MHFSVASILALAGTSVAAPFATRSDTSTDLQGSLTQVNRTHASFKIANRHPHAVSLLKHQTILHPGAEHSSLRVRPVANGSQSEPAGPGDAGVRYSYTRSVGDNSFVSIAAGSEWTSVFDVTQAFTIPAAGEYIVSLEGVFYGVYADTAVSGPMLGPRTQHLNPIHIDCEPATFELAASVESNRRRDTSNIFADCASTQTQLVANIQAAATMANDALNALSSNAPLVKTYFGIVNGQTEDFFAAYFEIQGTLGKIASYDPTKDTHLSWHCASNSPTKAPEYCEDDTLAYYLLKQSSVSLCSGYDGLAQSLGCEQPATTALSLNEQIGTILHELSHDATFSPQDVTDLPDPNVPGYNCYNYNCATLFANQRFATALPERSAINYEQFAQAARFLAHPNEQCNLPGGVMSATPPPSLTAAQADALPIKGIAD